MIYCNTSIKLCFVAMQYNPILSTSLLALQDVRSGHTPQGISECRHLIAGKPRKCICVMASRQQAFWYRPDTIKLQLSIFVTSENEVWEQNKSTHHCIPKSDAFKFQDKLAFKINMCVCGGGGNRLDTAWKSTVKGRTSKMMFELNNIVLQNTKF